MVNGQDVTLPTRKALALAAYLALSGPAPRGVLAGLLWELPERDARRNLRQELYRLGHTPLARWLAVGETHVALAGEVTTDVAEFRERAARGDWAGALGLYGGPLLDGLELESSAWGEWLERTRAGVARERQAAALRQAEALEARGEWREALGVHLALLAEDELQETHHRAVMHLYARLGERGAALAQYERCREVLRRDLALEPLPETRALAGRIRARESWGEEAAVPTPPRRPAIPQDPPLVGREREWAALEAAPRLILIEGEPGVGKSHLALEFARAHGPVLLHRSTRPGGATPLWAAAANLRSALGDPRAPGLLGTVAPVWRREAARLVPELWPGDDPPGPPTPDGRARFVEALVRVLAALIPPDVVIVQDDLQWMDYPSVEVLSQAALRLPNRVLLTLRRGEADTDAARQGVLALGRQIPLERLVLKPLGERGVRDLVWVLSGGEAPLFAARLHRATGGNPLALLETLRHLADTGALHLEPGGAWATPYDDQTRDYAELPLPDSVRGAVLARAARLGGGARRLLEAASLAGEPFTLADLGRASALPEWEAVEALEQAMAAGLLTVAGGGHRFSHEQVRSALESALGPERRRLLHRKLAEALLRQGGAPAHVAHHLERAGRPREAVPHRVRAAQAAAAVLAHAQALGEYRRALADGPDDPTAFAIHAEMVEHLRFLDRREERRAALEALSALAERLALPAEERLHQAVRWARFYTELDEEARALEVAERGLREFGDVPEPLLALLWLEGGAALCGLSRFGEAEVWLRRALEPLRDTSPLRHANTLYWLSVCALARHDHGAARERLGAALAGFRAVPFPRGVAMTLWRQAELAAAGGDLDACERLLGEAVAVARDIGNVDLHKLFLRELVGHLRGAGRPATTWRDEGVRLARDLGDAALEAHLLALAGGQ